MTGLPTSALAEQFACYSAYLPTVVIVIGYAKVNLNAAARIGGIGVSKR